MALLEPELKPIKLDLAAHDALVLDASTKGLPVSTDRITVGEVANAGWTLHEDLLLPAAVLRRSALEANGRWMRAFAGHAGVVFCPHGKTPMAPKIFQRQFDDGAWGLTCATIGHLRTYRRFGVPRVLYANQIASKSGALWLAKEMARDPGFELYVYVDSREGTQLLASAAEAANLNRPIPVLIEIGHLGARTGMRTVEEALDLARWLKGVKGLALAGVSAFEGVVPGGADAAMEPNVQALFATTVWTAETCAREGLFTAEGPVILSAGGSRFFDMAARLLGEADMGDKLVVIRSGCYVSHDALHYETAFNRLLERTHGDPGAPGRLRPAVEVWAEINSHPEPDRWYATLGRRDVSFDIDLPKPIAWMRPGLHATTQPLDGVKVTGLSDQHAHLTAGPDCVLKFGDQVGFGISHPCTTFDKWRVLFEVDDNGKVLGAMATYF
ncbi:MAG TPA: alanine racemase [Caulobacteraceae bacterium]|jgi:D-serine dehydratase|nr:alanine racemase [Caulobacteraceae bacterium]